MCDSSRMARREGTGAAPAGGRTIRLRRLRPGSRDVALAILVAVASPSALAGQDVLTFLASRQLASEEALQVQVDFAAGQLGLQAGPPGELYRMQLEYDEAGGTPVHEYADGELHVGVDHSTRISRRGEGEARLDLRITPDLPVGLTLQLGAIRGEVDLGGIRLQFLELTTGASALDLRVSRPNPVELDRAQIRVGAASLNARELGRLNARVLDVEAGIGDVKLDLEGLTRADTDMRVSMGMGSLEIGVPSGTGIRIDRSTFLTRLTTPPMVERAGAHYSTNWDTAEQRVTIELSAAIGRVTVVRLPD